MCICVALRPQEEVQPCQVVVLLQFFQRITLLEMPAFLRFDFIGAATAVYTSMPSSQGFKFHTTTLGSNLATYSFLCALLYSCIFACITETPDRQLELVAERYALQVIVCQFSNWLSALFSPFLLTRLPINLFIFQSHQSCQWHYKLVCCLLIVKTFCVCQFWWISTLMTCLSYFSYCSTVLQVGCTLSLISVMDTSFEHYLPLSRLRAVFCVAWLVHVNGRIN